MTDEPQTLDTEFYALSSDADIPEFLAVAKVYARDVVENYDLSVDVTALDWTVSKRAKRRAGAVEYRDGTPETVSLTWAYFQEHGWAATADVVRHELIHVHLLNEAGDASHGDAFREWATELRTSVTCERFADPNWWIVCEFCGSEMARYRKSKLVKHPEAYRCGGCGGRLYAREAGESGD
ncbi:MULTISPECIES: SprT-like domain-containing protein [Halobacterium]|uniref:SprT-like domain-containing protein n=1 Tax=Halobacterium TaxID=2239 RepID=UPI00073EC255|nr:MULTISPECIES: SprT-like domain-containing protein [Halobacterium]MCG1002994.1 SprT-like domain-containing protein [Halobacterium noricense]